MSAPAAASAALNTSLTLSNGQKVPIFGLGTWRSDKGKVETAVKHALENGYRHIDCAAVYANQEEVGRGIKAALENKDLGLKREDIYVVSKLWNNDHAKDSVEPAIRKTLKELQLDYLDLYLIHWPTPFQFVKDSPFPKDDKGHYLTSDVPIKETWLAMEELVRKGLVKSIGVSNFSTEEVDDLLTYATVKPVMNQVEAHPYLNQAELKKHHDAKNIHITAYSPLGNVDPEKKTSPLDDPAVAEIAKKYNKSPAQVLIRWSLDSGFICIPKSVTPDRIIENSKVFDFKLTNDEVSKLAELTNTKFSRMINPPFRPNGTTVFKK